MAFLDWLRDNWSPLLQILGLFFTGLALLLQTIERRIANLFEATKQHREIWSAIHERDDLRRIDAAAADLQIQPVTSEEELHVSFIILHFATNFRAAKFGMFFLPTQIRLDIDDFFSRPIPRAVWEKLRRFQEPDFVRFVEQHRDR